MTYFGMKKPKVKRGMALRLDEIIDQLRMANAELTHYIIAYQAGDKTVEDKKSKVKSEIKELETELEGMLA